MARFGLLGCGVIASAKLIGVHFDGYRQRRRKGFHDMRRAILLIAAILTEVGGSLALKGGLEFPWLYALTVLGYVASFILLAMVLKAGLPLGVTYGIWGATDVALTAIGSSLIFGEPFTPLMGLGIVLVAAGVLCVEFGAAGGFKDEDEDSPHGVAFGGAPTGPIPVVTGGK